MRDFSGGFASTYTVRKKSAIGELSSELMGIWSWACIKMWTLRTELRKSLSKEKFKNWSSSLNSSYHFCKCSYHFCKCSHFWTNLVVVSFTNSWYLQDTFPIFLQNLRTKLPTMIHDWQTFLQIDGDLELCSHQDVNSLYKAAKITIKI